MPVDDHLLFRGQGNRHRSESQLPAPERRVIDGQKVARYGCGDVLERLILGPGQQGQATGSTVGVRGQVDIAEAASGLREQRQGQFRAGVGREGFVLLKFLFVERDRGLFQNVRRDGLHIGGRDGLFGGGLLPVLHQEGQVHVAGGLHLLGEHRIELFRREIRLEKEDIEDHGFGACLFQVMDDVAMSVA